MFERQMALENKNNDQKETAGFLGDQALRIKLQQEEEPRVNIIRRVKKHFTFITVFI